MKTRGQCKLQIKLKIGYQETMRQRYWRMAMAEVYRYRYQIILRQKHHGSLWKSNKNGWKASSSAKCFCWLSSDYRFWWWQKHNFLFFDSLQSRLTLPSGWTNSRESCDQNEFSNHSPLHFPIFRSHARKSYHRISQRSETRHIAGAGDIVFGDPGRLAMAIA